MLKIQSLKSNSEKEQMSHLKLDSSDSTNIKEIERLNEKKCNMSLYEKPQNDYYYYKNFQVLKISGKKHVVLRNKFSEIITVVSKVDSCLYSMLIVEKHKLDDLEEYKASLKLHFLSDNEYIYKLESYYETRDNIYLIMENVEGENLSKFLKDKKNEDNEYICKLIFESITNILQYLHSQNILHGNISSQNFFIHQNKIKLVLFQNSSIVENHNMNADLFGLGVILNESIHRFSILDVS